MCFPGPLNTGAPRTAGCAAPGRGREIARKRDFMEIQFWRSTTPARSRCAGRGGPLRRQWWVAGTPSERFAAARDAVRMSPLGWVDTGHGARGRDSEDRPDGRLPATQRRSRRAQRDSNRHGRAAWDAWDVGNGDSGAGPAGPWGRVGPQCGILKIPSRCRLATACPLSHSPGACPDGPGSRMRHSNGRSAYW